jgi:uncharacterized membrane protein
MWALAARPAMLALVYAAGATIIAMLTPIVRTAGVIGALPLWVQWYVRPSGEYTTFTGFPWAGFVFAGAACGVVLASASKSREARLHVAFAGVGVALVALGAYTSIRPAIYQQSSFWTSSPTWFAIRVGLMMTGLALAYAASRSTAGHDIELAFHPIERFGRSSLFVYWIHVELVYGIFSRLWRGRLPIWGAVTAWVVFSALMYGAVIVRDRLVESWRTRRPTREGPAPETLPA